MLEKVKEYFDREYEYVANLLTLEKRPIWAKNTKEICWNAIQRCLGVVSFAQNFDIDREDLDFYYEKTKAKILDLI